MDKDKAKPLKKSAKRSGTSKERHDTPPEKQHDAAQEGAPEDTGAVGSPVVKGKAEALLVPVLAQLTDLQRELDGLKAGQEAIQIAMKARAKERQIVGQGVQPSEAKRETKALEDMDTFRKSRKSAKPPGDGVRDLIMNILVTADNEELERQRLQSLEFDLAGIKERIRVTAKDPAELFYAIDIGMVVVICANAVIIGASIDDDRDRNAWKWVSFAFSMAFLAELLFKTALAGPWRQFCGPGALSNIFDASLITADLVQFIMSAAGADKKGPSASLFRIVRLVRLMRILRVMRLEFFQGLLAMVGGMITGAPTLLCAMGMFGVICYVLALIFRELLGAKIGQDDDDPNVTQFFRSVPQSMYMVFRCALIVDCSAPNGNNAFWEIAELYGNGWMVVYFIFIFGICIGLFNVIGAIFVEETLKAAKDFALSQKNARLNNHVLWSVNIAKLIRCLLKDVRSMEEAGLQGPEEDGQADRPNADAGDGQAEPFLLLADHIDEIANLQVSGERFAAILREQTDARDALDALEIDPNDHGNLSDILDPDNGGIIDIFELLDGLRRLRGDPRRSDIVAVDLMVRSLQKQIEELLRRVLPK